MIVFTQIKENFIVTLFVLLLQYVSIIKDNTIFLLNYSYILIFIFYNIILHHSNIYVHTYKQKHSN